MEDPLAPAPVEIVLGVSVLLGLAVAVFLVVGAARGRFEWVPTGILALAALMVPVVGPAVALYCIPKLRQPTAAHPS